MQKRKRKKRMQVPLRLDSDLAEWLGEASDKGEWSRNELIASWLGVLRELALVVKRADAVQADPEGLIDDLAEVVGKWLVQFGLGNVLVEAGIAFKQMEREQLLQLARRGLLEWAGKEGGSVSNGSSREGQSET